MSSYTLAIDAMGGDYAPEEIVKGAVAAAEQHGYEILLVGQEDVLGKELAKYNRPDCVTIIHAPEVVAMDEPPALALRRKKGTSACICRENGMSW